MTAGLPDCSNIKVLIVGDVMLDRYLHGSAQRISPEAPVPVVTVEGTEERPGGAANVAVNVAALGATAHLIGCVGKDHDGDCLQRMLSDHGVQTDFIESDQPTITKSRVVSSGQQLMRLDFESSKAAVEQNALFEKLKRHLESADVVILSDYAKGCLYNIEPLIALIKESGKPLLIDPKGNDFARYRGATVLTPNTAEFEAVAGKSHSEEELLTKAEALRQTTELDCLLLTRGENGMSVIEQDGAQHLPARAHEVYDVTGAGDTVVAVFAVMLATGTPFIAAAQFANQAAGLVIEKSGTATVSPSEFARYGHHAAAICTQDQVRERVQAAKQRGQKIVFTNGCFDLLHAGHIEYLAQAASLGDQLVVAVNDDASLKKLKGNDRPLNSLDRRMQLLAALAMVDWVVPFSEDTPQQLIEMLCPDILVKGGDYKIEEIVGSAYVKEQGGEVIVLEYVEGFSTSRIIDTIRGDAK